MILLTYISLFSSAQNWKCILSKQTQVIACVTLFSMYPKLSYGESQMLYTKRMNIRVLYLLWWVLQVTRAAEERYRG